MREAANPIHPQTPEVLSAAARSLWKPERRAVDRTATGHETTDVEKVQCAVPSFAVIACQRSGTHLLREIINSNKSIALLAEPFSVSDDPAQWCNYVRTCPTSEYPPQSTEAALDLLDRYLEAIQRDTRSRRECYGGYKSWQVTIGLDVKYNQLRAANPLFNDLLARPFLLEYLSTRRIPVIHLVRRNLAHAALSNIIANQRKIWHTYAEVRIDGRYHVSTDELLRYMNWIKKERAEFVRQAWDLSMETVAYEDLVSDLAHVDIQGYFPKETRVLSRLAGFLHVSNQFRTDGCMRKVINRPYSELLDNCDELVMALEASEFAEFAPTLGVVHGSIDPKRPEPDATGVRCAEDGRESVESNWSI